MAYYVPPSEKLGGHVPRVPHQIAPMIPQTDVTTTSPNLKQKRIVTLIPGRTDGILQCSSSAVRNERRSSIQAPNIRDELHCKKLLYLALVYNYVFHSALPMRCITIKLLYVWRFC